MEDERKEMIISRRKLPVSKVVSTEQPTRRKPGSLKGKLKAKRGAFKPLSAKELKMWETG